MNRANTTKTNVSLRRAWFLVALALLHAAAAGVWALEKQKTYSTSMGILRGESLGEKLVLYTNPPAMDRLVLIVNVAAGCGAAIGDSLEVVRGNTRSEVPRQIITLTQDTNQNQWIATDGWIAATQPDAVSFDRTLVTAVVEGHIVKIVGGSNQPIKIGGEFFADTTVAIKDGKPVPSGKPRLLAAAGQKPAPTRDSADAGATKPDLSLLQRLIGEAEKNETLRKDDTVSFQRWRTRVGMDLEGTYGEAVKILFNAATSESGVSYGVAERAGAGLGCLEGMLMARSQGDRADSRAIHDQIHRFIKSGETNRAVQEDYFEFARWYWQVRSYLDSTAGSEAARKVSGAAFGKIYLKEKLGAALGALDALAGGDIGTRPAPPSASTPPSVPSLPARSIKPDGGAALPTGSDHAARYLWQGGPGLPKLAADGIVVREIMNKGRRLREITPAPGGKGNIPFSGDQMIIDMPGSKDIHLAIHPELGTTTYAGLTFSVECVLEILPDGTLAANRAGVTADDSSGRRWTSRETTHEGRRVIAFFPGGMAQTARAAAPPTITAAQAYAEKGRSLLPPFTKALKGSHEVRVVNPNAFPVQTGIRSDKSGRDFDIPAFGTESVKVPNGTYEIYFVYSENPGLPGQLHQGDNFTIRGNGIQITITKVAGGNYGIRKVK